MKKMSTLKKSFTFLLLAFGFCFNAKAQETPLFTGETSPEAITYYDFVEWSIADVSLVSNWYADFGGGKYTTVTDNPDQTGINKSAKSLFMNAIKSIDWWGNFLNLRLGSPITITESNRYLHMLHYREILNDGYSVSLNANEPLGGGDMGTLRFDGNLTKAGKWEDIVIDLKYLMDNSIPLEKVCVLVDKDWNGPRDNPPSKYYFDEIMLNNDPLQRGVTILTGTSLLNCQSQAQIDSLSFDTQNAANTYSIVPNPFTTSTVNPTGKVLKFSKSVECLSWQGLGVSFPGIHIINYGQNQYLHMLVRTDTVCDIEVVVVDNFDVWHTEMLSYPKDDINGEWFDLVLDLSSYSAIKAFTLRYDVRKDLSGNWIDNTPARDFYLDEVTLDGNPDQREVITTGVKPSINKTDLKFYTMGRTIYFSLPDASRVNVYDMVGRNVASQNLNNSSELNAITVPNSGMYILKVGTRNGNCSTVKFIVK